MTGFAHFLVAALLAMAVPAARAQVYKWVDESGHVHYGEKPPAGAKANTVKPPPAAADPSARPIDLQSQENDFRGRQIKKGEEETRQAQDEANRAAMCSNARNRLAVAERAALYRLEKGERVFFSDAEQKAEIENGRAAVKRYCG